MKKTSVLVSHSAVRQQSSFFSQAARPRKSSSALRHEKLLQPFYLELSEFDQVNGIKNKYHTVFLQN